MASPVTITTMGATGNTIPVEGAAGAASRPSSEGSWLKPLLQGVLILAASVFLLYLAWPRLQASLLYLPVDTAINNYYATGEANPAQLKGLRQRARDAIAVYPHHRYYDGLSLLYYLDAARSDNRLFERRAAFEESILAAEASLDHAPAQPRAWLRIAQARSWLRYPPEQVIEALKMAIYTGRVEPSMYLTRLGLGLAYLPRMDSEARSLMRDQVLLAWDMQRGTVARALKAGELKFAPMEQLLEGTHQSVLDEIREAAGGPVR